MAPKASDLSSDQKYAVSNFIREKIGSDNYDRMVRELGSEDAAIDLVLDAMSRSSSGSSSSKDELGNGGKIAVGISIFGISIFIVIPLVISLLVAIGYGLWKLFAYTGGGVASWFEWLSGHF